jgi:hypothetical protein
MRMRVALLSILGGTIGAASEGAMVRYSNTDPSDAPLP